jgi:Tfp pilus assembly protein PilX
VGTSAPVVCEFDGRATIREWMLMARNNSLLPNKPLQGQRGMALIMTLFVLAILSLLGLGLITTSNLETRINHNSRSAYPAYYAAEAGLEEATYRLSETAVNPISLGLLDSPSKVVYLRQDSSVDPTDSSSPYYDGEYPGSNFTTVQYVSTNQGSTPIPYKWVKISLKTKRLSGQDVDNSGLTTNQDAPIYFDGAQYLYDPINGINSHKMGFPVFQVTSFSMTPDGATYKIRREVSSAGFPGLPAALLLNGPNPVFNAPSGLSFWVAGTDLGGSGVDRPAIGVLSGADAVPISAGLPDPTHYTGSGDVTPDVESIGSRVPSMYRTPKDLEEFVDRIASHSQTVYPPGTTQCSGADCWGTPVNPVINVFNGDCNLGANTGYGVLIVRGGFQMLGSGSFNGLIFVVGQGTMTVTFPGTGQILGGVFVAKTRDLSGNLLPTLGRPAVNWAAGGGLGIYYHSGLINQLLANLGYLKLAYKELSL